MFIIEMKRDGFHEGWAVIDWPVLDMKEEGIATLGVKDFKTHFTVIGKEEAYSACEGWIKGYEAGLPPPRMTFVGSCGDDYFPQDVDAERVVPIPLGGNDAKD